MITVGSKTDSDSLLILITPKQQLRTSQSHFFPETESECLCIEYAEAEII